MRRARSISKDRFDGPAQSGVGLAAFEVNEAVPCLGPTSSPESDRALPKADLLGDLVIAKAVEGQEDEGGPLPEMRGSRDGVVERAEDVMLTFSDGDLSRLTRHGESSPCNWETSKAR